MRAGQTFPHNKCPSKQQVRGIRPASSCDASVAAAAVRRPEGAHRTPRAHRANSWPNDDDPMRWAAEPADISPRPYTDGFLKEYEGGLGRPVLCAAIRISGAVRIFPPRGRWFSSEIRNVRPRGGQWVPKSRGRGST